MKKTIDFAELSTDDVTISTKKRVGHNEMIPSQKRTIPFLSS
ncbi:hypothetical protein [Bacillus sp. CGMCC 1.16541]|nr:hypothetical protein [Bacillus sp. CGMCC 1.16541]